MSHPPASHHTLSFTSSLVRLAHIFEAEASLTQLSDQATHKAPSSPCSTSVGHPPFTGLAVHHRSSNNRQVKLHADSHYGDDDPTQWAQPYVPYHSHLAAIPHPNTLLNHRIIWWTPTIGDFSCPPLCGPMSGLGKLCPPRYNELRTSVIFLNHRVTKYRESTLSKQNPANVQPSVK